METAKKLIIERGGREVTVNLSRPFSIGELYDLLGRKGVRPAILTVAGNVARASY